jgi:hypothetical protein
MATAEAASTDAYRTAHYQLAEYFRSVGYDYTLPNKWRTDRVRSLSEFPFHQTRSEMWEELAATLSDLDFITAKCAAGMTYELVTDYDTALAALPEGRQAREQERERDKRLTRYTAELIAYARAWSEARDRSKRDPVEFPPGDPVHVRLPLPPPTVRMWTDEEIDADTERLATTPMRIDRLRAFGRLLAAESHQLARFGALSGFCLQQVYNAADSGPVARAAEARLGRLHSPATLLLCPAAERRKWSPHAACERTLTGHAGMVRSVAVTPDGRRAVSGSWDGTLRVWDLATGACARTLAGHTRMVEGVALTPDGQF